MSSSTLAKAELVGAKTVKGASSPVPSGKAVSRAVRRVENLSSVASNSPVVGRSPEPGLIEGMKPLLPPTVEVGVGLLTVTGGCIVLIVRLMCRVSRMG